MKNLSVYNSEMKKSLMDKIFFIDKVPTNIFVDFGCADGTVIKFLASIYPENKYYGYDRSREMIGEASRKPVRSVCFYRDFPMLCSGLCISPARPITMLASSVLHEVYNEGRQEEFWGSVDYLAPQYLVIRDMCVSKHVNRMSDPVMVARINRQFSSVMIEEFEARWGSLYGNRSLVHFLLKYRFQENWRTELQENYFPFTYEQLLKDLSPDYEIVYQEHYILPYIKQSVMDAFGVDLQDRTHVKFILKRR